MAVMSAAVVAPLAGGDMAAYATLSAALALTVGVMLILAGIVKLGFISDFLSKSVITGFVFGLAISIAVSQAPKLFGVPAGSGSTIEQFVELLGNLSLTNPWTLAVSASSLAIVVFLRLRYKRIPAAPVVLVYGIVVVSLFNLTQYGVSVVGAVPQGLPQLERPGIERHEEIYLIIGALGIIFLAVGESLGTARAYAAKYDYAIDANQELMRGGGQRQRRPVSGLHDRRQPFADLYGRTSRRQNAALLVGVRPAHPAHARFPGGDLPESAQCGAGGRRDELCAQLDGCQGTAPLLRLAPRRFHPCLDRAVWRYLHRCADRPADRRGALPDLYRLPCQPALRCAARPVAGEQGRFW